eukprot:Gregarina_sp_Pseudo_9__4659@NODE_484_length_2725_cov_21_191363_g456_i0_p2_GENE_NODE_484_length_2725_cov_21_191363_g456_i0NODE_484_length_2725_cov_21_191363_g456_i0_p2_ORF_typecomplete_len256_score22_76MDM1/PF15501_6/0_0077_NODE_484_length_2725_cov_21_191363_g456_i03161083
MVKNRFGLTTYHTGVQTDACFMYQWKQLEWPMSDFRGALVDTESKPCPEGVRKVLPQHGQHDGLEFENCDACQIRGACLKEDERLRQPARRNNNEPKVTMSETGTPSAQSRSCDCLHRDLHCSDLDFGLVASRPPNDEWLNMHRGRAEREMLRRTKATQTPSDSVMSQYWLEQEEQNYKEIAHNAELVGTWERVKKSVNSKGEVFELPYYLREPVELRKRPQPYKRKVYGDIAPPADGWSGYIKGPRISDSEMSS